MKKIMIIVAALALSASAFAASVNWTYQAANTYAGYSIYLTTSAGAFDSLDKIVEASIVPGATADLVSGARAATAKGTLAGLSANTEYDFFYVAVKGDDYWVSSAQKVTTGADTAAAASTTFSTANGNSMLSASPTGSFSSVPEPTSGLLLLLGMAGLALKRKVA